MEKFNFTQDGIDKMNETIHLAMLNLLVMNSNRTNEEIFTVFKDAVNAVIDAIGEDFDTIRNSAEFKESVEEFNKYLEEIK
jgi:hypothetical protein